MRKNGRWYDAEKLGGKCAVEGSSFGVLRVPDCGVACTGIVWVDTLDVWDEWDDRQRIRRPWSVEERILTPGPPNQ